MYNCLNKFKIIFIIWLIFLPLGSGVFWDDLSDNIYSTFKRQFDWWSKDSFLETPYSSNFPKDPYVESFDDIEDMSRQLKISWTEYIEKVMAENGCSLSKKKIWSILYYFVPEFRSDLVQTMKVGLGDYASKNFTFDRNKIIKYCDEYYSCNEYDEKETGDNGTIRKDTPQNVLTNCKEFFEENYKRWKDSEQRKQKLQVSQVAFDKYWNSTIDDSPYDIMIDFWTIWRILYTEAEQPITPVFYSLPMFSNSTNQLKKHKETWSSYSDWWENGNGSGGWWNGWGGWQSGGNGASSSSDPIPLKLPRDLIWWASMEDGYDSLVEWLWAYNVKQNNAQSYWSLCDDSEKEPEQEDEDDNDNSSDTILPVAPDLSDYTDEELQELVDYMKSAVDEYASLPEGKKEEMRQRAWNITDFERSAREIKNCWKWCEWLRIDQYASCMIMCTCGEIKSSDDPINLFDPEKFPWLWPIFVIRFCAVPATNTNFSKWWKKIVSIEEWVREIYGAVDKLSREWRLWIWTQEYNFLDSSTKKMNMADTVAFSIDIEFVDIAGMFANHSEQYLKKEIKNANKSWQKDYHISNNLEDPLFKNNYVLMDEKGKLGDVTNQSNAEWTERSKSNLSVESSSTVDLNSDSRASHYSNKSQLLDKWLDQQGDLWINILKYTEEATNRTRALDAKPKEP